MSRPLIGITANQSLINDTYAVQATGVRNIEAIVEASGCMAVVIPGDPNAIDTDTLMGMLDGVLLTGGRPNVHPSYYGHEETEGHGPFDRGRDDALFQRFYANHGFKRTGGPDRMSRHRLG